MVEPLLELHELGFRYPGADTSAVDGVSFTARPGQVLGLLGPNGAGKTTLISQLAGLLPLQRGRVRVAGEPLAALRRREPTYIALAPQELAFYPALTVTENLACFASAARLSGVRHAERMRTCMALAQLERYADQRAAQLSGGLKRRLNLAIAMLPEPQVLLFDEPTVGVDPQARAFLLDAIRALAGEGRTVIYTSHYMEEVEAIADHVVIVDHGLVLRDGSLNDLRGEGASAVTLEHLFMSLTDRTLREA